MMQVLVAYVFLLPLVSVQVPSIIAGFSINLARGASFGLIGLSIFTACLQPGRDAFTRGLRTIHPAMLIWTLFLGVMLSWYYIQVGFGYGLRFADADSFFRSWKGRPLGLFLSTVTYAVVPYVLIRSYAANPAYRRLLEGAFAAVIVLLVWYGYFQQMSFYLGLPTTGRLLFEGSGVEMRLPTFGVNGISLLRFYSLGGEPRDYGTFALGAFLFFLYWRRDRGPRTRVTAAAIAVSIILTMSTSTFIAVLLFTVVAVVDAVVQGFISMKSVARAGFYLLIAVSIVLGTTVDDILGARTLEYVRAIISLLGQTNEYAYLLRAQANDLVALFYVAELPRQGILHAAFGHGLGNFASGASQPLLQYFRLDIAAEGLLEDSRSFLLKTLVEGGLVGVAILSGLFVTTLRKSQQLMARTTATEWRQELFLRYSYIAFFVAAMIHTSFYHFILMAIIHARAASEPTVSVAVRSGKFTV